MFDRGEVVAALPFSAAKGTSYVYVGANPASGAQSNLVDLGRSMINMVEAQLDSDAPTGTYTTPTLTITIQTSLDATNWNDLVAFTQVGDAAGAEDKNKHASDTVQLGRYLRLASGAPTYTGTVTLRAA